MPVIAARHIFTFYVFLFGFPLIAPAQPALSTNSKKAIAYYIEADDYRVHGQYNKAVDLLRRAISKDKNFEEAWFRLGLTLKNEAQLQQSSDAYEGGLALSKDIRKQSAYRYELGDNYLKLGKYTRSLEMLNQYLNVDKASTVKNEQARIWKQNAEYGLAHAQEDLGYHPIMLSDTVNAFPMQYFPVLTADNRQLVFTERNGHGYDDDEDLYISVKNDSGQWTAPVSISDKINTTFREGACTISADGRYLIFTGCGVKGYGRCDLFESKKTGDIWSVPSNLGPMVNSRDWDVQPALSADGRELYFVSDRRGSVGGSDIWYSKKDSTGRWTKAVNAGPVINTKYDEVSPFIHVNNRSLYFASNAHPGFGGLDIFTSEKIDRTWGTPKNMGGKLNTFEDQYSFFVTADGKQAYFAKDDAGKRNYTRLYKTTLPPELRVKYYSNVVKGIVRDKDDGKPLHAKVELIDIQKNERVSMVDSDSLNGQYTIVLTQGAEYALYSSRPGYLFNSLAFDYEKKDRQEPVVLNIDLQKVNVNAVAVLNNVFFDTDKYDLDVKSASELNVVVHFLSTNPAIRVEIGGFTDDTGAEGHNMELSLKRAQSVADYLSAHGIDAHRVTKKGYGPRFFIKPNDNEVNRQANRRIEFRIIK